VPLPAATLDIVSEYPSVCILKGMQRFLIAERLEVEECTEFARSLLDRVTAEDCFDPNFWPELACCFVEFAPAGDAVPVKAQYDRTNIGQGINLLTGRSRCFAIDDAIVSKLTRGRDPDLTNAWRLVPVGVQEGLRPYMIPGIGELDLRYDNLYQALVEERQRVKQKLAPYDVMSDSERERLQQFFKTASNATEYGIFGEVRSERKRRKVKVDVYGMDHFYDWVDRVETPGQWFFSPFAATITAGGRLLLSLTLNEIAQRGGSFVFADTDAVAIVASESGGLVPCTDGTLTTDDGRPAISALPHADIQEIQAKLNRLNPYDRGLIPQMLRLEDENFCGLSGHAARCRCRQLYAWSLRSKAYCLYNREGEEPPVLRKWSEFGLGNYLNPTSPWKQDRRGERPHVEKAWQYMLEEELGLSPEEPSWLDDPVLTSLSVGSLEEWERWDKENADKPYAEQVQPFSELIAVHPRRGIDGRPMIPKGADPSRFLLVARPPADWTREEILSLPWRTRHDGKRYPVTTAQFASTPNDVVLKRWRDVLMDYRAAREAKRAGPDGLPSRRSTHGPLQMLRVIERRMRYLGKESVDEEARDNDIPMLLEDYQLEYVDRASDAEMVREATAEMSPRKLAAAGGISTRRAKDEGSSPRKRAEREAAARAVLLDELATMGVSVDAQRLGLEALMRLHRESLVVLRTEVWERLQRTAERTSGARIAQALRMPGVAGRTVNRWLTDGLPENAQKLALLRERLSGYAVAPDSGSSESRSGS
jgi:hypothetical protein